MSLSPASAGLIFELELSVFKVPNEHLRVIGIQVKKHPELME